ncbi:MAG: hypothetical protein LBI57_01890, partial [Helicobacteraceae bacterium]|nr:hypothetical protein [Helicobacteraceae bacterium]
TGEGWFYFHGTITFEAPEGEVFANEEAIWTERTNSLSVFAFEGEFFVGTGNDGGFRNAFVRTLRQNNEYIGLRAKRDAVDNWQLNQLDNPDETISEPKFSDKEQNRLNQIENQAAKDLNKKYYDQHPIQPKLQDAIQPQSVKSLPKKGETVTLSVNWSSNAVRASFLPVDGAAISVTNNANGKEIASGVINNGGFSFVSPDNNLSFTAKVSAGYKGDFSVKNDDAEDDAENKVIEIGFSDVNTFDIDVAINDDSDLLDIKEFEADAWSVFHAVAEMQRLASEDLGVKKERGDNAVVNWF